MIESLRTFIESRHCLQQASTASSLINELAQKHVACLSQTTIDRTNCPCHLKHIKVKTPQQGTTPQ